MSSRLDPGDRFHRVGRRGFEEALADLRAGADRVARYLRRRGLLTDDGGEAAGALAAPAGAEQSVLRSRPRPPRA